MAGVRGLLGGLALCLFAALLFGLMIWPYILAFVTGKWWWLLLSLAVSFLFTGFYRPIFRAVNWWIENVIIGIDTPPKTD